MVEVDPEAIGVVYISGTPWDGFVSMDRELARAMGAHVPILWVDPPDSIRRITERLLHFESPRRQSGLDVVAGKVCRLRVTGIPGLTRPGLRKINATLLNWRIRRTVKNLRITTTATILSNPTHEFPQGVAGARVFFVTDDWVAGAQMMGMNPKWLEAVFKANLNSADTVAAISPALVENIKSRSPRSRVRLLPNGCKVASSHSEVLDDRPKDLPNGQYAVLIGTLNERLDVDAIESVADHRARLLVIGPRSERDPSLAARLDKLLNRPEITYLGPKQPHELEAYLRHARVGITPYANNEFNRGSFPLKTLEYLSAGLKVVSTDIPASRWLNTPHVHVAKSAREFGSTVSEVLSSSQDDFQGRKQRWEFARLHSWDERAASLISMEPRIATGSQRW